MACAREGFCWCLSPGMRCRSCEPVLVQETIDFLKEIGPLVLTSSLCVQPQTLIVRTSRELVASKVSWSIEYSKGSDIAGWFHAHALLSVLKREAG